MTFKQKISFIGSLVILAVLGFANLSHANPLFFPATAQFATATTTVQYFATGTATTTLVTFDSYSQGQPKATDKGVLLVQEAASSTSSVIQTTLEYSQDGIDWYADNTITASGVNNTSAPIAFAWTAAGTATSSKAYSVPMPTRYVRAKFSVTGAGAAVWAQIVPQRQSN